MGWGGVGRGALARGWGAGPGMGRGGRGGGREAGATAVQTGLSLLNELEGAGLLGMPYAVGLVGGAAGGAACIACVGAAAGFTGVLLSRCMYEPRGAAEGADAGSGSGGSTGDGELDPGTGRPTGPGERVRDSYAAVGGAAIGSRGRTLVLGVQMLNLNLVASSYLVLMGSCLSFVLPTPQQLLGGGWGGGTAVSARAWTIVATLVCLPTVHLGGYKRLAALSVLGVLCLLCIFSLGVYYGVRQEGEPGAPPPLPPPTLQQVPASISMFLFAFSCHGIFPDLEKSMARPQLFPRVVGSVFAANALLKMTFAFLLCSAFGGAIDPVVAANFPSAAARQAVSLLVCANALMSFPFPLVPVFRTLGCLAEGGAKEMALEATGVPNEGAPLLLQGEQSGSGRHAGGGRWRGTAERSVVVLCCGAVAVLVGNFAVVMGLMGSVTLSLLTFVFPATFYLRLHKPRGVLHKACLAVVAVGAVGGIAGTASTVYLALWGG